MEDMDDNMGEYGQQCSDRNGYDDQVEGEQNDVYSQLAQREEDLMLAAELGKALLEKNEELQRQNEDLTKEYTQKIENLTQEKYELKIRLESAEGEYKNTVRELQNDIAILKQQLEEQQYHSKISEREKIQIVQQLQQQNDRLNEQLRMVATEGTQFRQQVETLSGQVNARRASMKEHVIQLESLKDEINLLTSRNHELERRLQVLREERENLACRMEGAQERIQSLEVHCNQKDQEVESQQSEITQLHNINATLHEKLEELSLQSQNEPCAQSGGSSLFEELGQASCSSLYGEMMEPSFQEEESLGRGGDRPNTLLASGVNFVASPMLFEDDIECDDDDITLAAGQSTYMADNGEMVAMAMTPDSLMPARSRSHESSMTPDSLGERQLMQLLQSPDEVKQDYVVIYKQLKRLLRDLRGKSQGEPTLEDAQLYDVRADSIQGAISDLRGLLESIARQKLEEENAQQESSTQESQHSQNAISHGNAEAELRQKYEEMKHEIVAKDEALKLKTQELSDLTQKLSLQQRECVQLKEEHDLMTASGVSSLNRDCVVEQAKRERDEALDKRNQMEMELAQAKLDLMSMDEQLMEAIQQKIELSQQLEQWQMDMQLLLDNQIVHERITQDCKKDSELKHSTVKPKSTFLFRKRSTSK
ncbi:unnamed protein product [Owenia fusiformis]|uniref:Bicaudal D-related protein 1 n=1 Tax=Owenia fusiformis TaxID=6347 RepID=A0A8S4Q9W1_OWEFU|nr:unnamed protein product [Owenia fusiformis]